MPKLKTSREELVQKALSIFKLRGYYNTSIADLADACQVQKAHFYYYFTNKEEILQAALQLASDNLLLPLAQVAYDSTKTYSERLRYVLEQLQIFYMDTRLGCVMTDAVTQGLNQLPTISDITQPFFSKLVNIIAYLYQDRYSAHYAVGKAEQAVQDMYGGLLFAQIFNDNQYFMRALERISKKL